jgi:hypothetical protein
MLSACYGHDVANIQIKNVPEPLMRKIRREADLSGRTIRDFVLDAIQKKLAREEFAIRLAKRKPVEIAGVGKILDDIREERDREIDP